MTGTQRDTCHSLMDEINICLAGFCGGSFCFMSWCLKFFCADGALCMFSYLVKFR